MGVFFFSIVHTVLLVDFGEMHVSIDTLSFETGNGMGMGVVKDVELRCN
mgnify:CR=1 FL=1|jgi:hypothetical protein